MEEKKFKCGNVNCGSSKGYEEKRVWDGAVGGPARHSRTECYYCKECSVMFMDPKLFSVSEPETEEP